MDGGINIFIQADINELSNNDLRILLGRHEKEIKELNKLYDYYFGESKIKHKKREDPSAPNNKLVNNYCSYISDMSTGFFIGKPISYTSENEEALKKINEIFKYNDESAHNMELAETASICGCAYELLYLNEDANIRFTSLDPREVILIADATVGQNIKFAIRHYRIYSLDGTSYITYIDVYDNEKCKKYKYDRNKFELLSENYHMFDSVPIIEYKNNKYSVGDFKKQISLIDGYDKTQSLTLDDMEDFTNAFLILKGFGYGEENVNEAKMMRKLKMLFFPDGECGAEWLTKTINDTFIENMKNRLNADIHKFSFVPDMTDVNFASNASGVAIKYKLIGLEQIRSRKERFFKKAIQRRIELIFGVLSMLDNNFDFRDIELTFSDNIPANIKELAEIVKSLTGIVSQTKLLSLLPFVNDPQKEMEIINKEKFNKKTVLLIILQTIALFLTFSGTGFFIVGIALILYFLLTPKTKSIWNRFYRIFTSDTMTDFWQRQ